MCKKWKGSPPWNQTQEKYLQKYSWIPLHYENTIKIEEISVKISILDWNFHEKQQKIEEFWAITSIFYQICLENLKMSLKNARYCWKVFPKKSILDLFS